MSFEEQQNMSVWKWWMSTVASPFMACKWELYDLPPDSRVPHFHTNPNGTMVHWKIDLCRMRASNRWYFQGIGSLRYRLDLVKFVFECNSGMSCEIDIIWPKSLLCGPHSTCPGWLQHVQNSFASKALGNEFAWVTLKVYLAGLEFSISTAVVNGPLSMDVLAISWRSETGTIVLF